MSKIPATICDQCELHGIENASKVSYILYNAIMRCPLSKHGLSVSKSTPNVSAR